MFIWERHSFMTHRRRKELSERWFASCLPIMPAMSQTGFVLLIGGDWWGMIPRENYGALLVSSPPQMLLKYRFPFCHSHTHEAPICFHYVCNSIIQIRPFDFHNIKKKTYMMSDLSCESHKSKEKMSINELNAFFNNTVSILYITN